MEKKEKIQARIGKYLNKLDEEDRKAVLEELLTMVSDEEEKAGEQPTENEVGEETPAEESQKEEETVEEKTETTEEEKVEESTDDSNPEEAPAEEEVANKSEEVGDEESGEDKVEEKVEEESTEEKEETPEGIDWKAKFEEMQKANEGLVARIEAVEDVISRLGLVEDDGTMGASPNGQPHDEAPNDSFNDIIRKRVG